MPAFRRSMSGQGQPISAQSVWLDRNQPVEQMTWAPGLPADIKDRLVTAGGWIERPGCTVFNLYRPPSLRARPGDASSWVDHVEQALSATSATT